VRSRSRLSRLAAIATSLTTLLWLGCLGFEPILDAMDGSAAHAAMTCSGGAMAASGSTEVHNSSSGNSAVGGQSIISAPGQSGAHMCYDCGCQSCVAPAAAVSTVRAVGIPPMHAPRADVMQLVGIATQPLLPPPERLI
jgi:hypothetical protein